MECNSSGALNSTHTRLSTASEQSAGGVVGSVEADGSNNVVTLRACHNSGRVVASRENAVVSKNAAGVVARALVAGRVLVVGCANTGGVHADSAFECAGVVHSNEAHSGSVAVYDSANHGELSGCDRAWGIAKALNSHDRLVSTGLVSTGTGNAFVFVEQLGSTPPPSSPVLARLFLRGLPGADTANATPVHQDLSSDCQWRTDTAKQPVVEALRSTGGVAWTSALVPAAATHRVVLVLANKLAVHVASGDRLNSVPLPTLQQCLKPPPGKCVLDQQQRCVPFAPDMVIDRDLVLTIGDIPPPSSSSYSSSSSFSASSLLPSLSSSTASSPSSLAPTASSSSSLARVQEPALCVLAAALVAAVFVCRVLTTNNKQQQAQQSNTK